MSIRFEKVCKQFNPPLGKVVLNDVSFETKQGEILFIIGKSGVGKSVTLKHVVGMLQPDSGTVTVESTQISGASIDTRRRVRSICGMVFQQPALLDSLTVFDNLAFGVRTPQFIERNGSPLTDTQIEDRILQKISLVNLEPRILNRFPNEISYGMQKRVSLARTLVPEPRILLFDEPTTGLDPITTQAINVLIRDLSRRLKTTSIVVSHDMKCALDIADRILVLDEGRILSLGTPAEIKHSKEQLIRDFLSEVLEMEST